MGKQRADDRHAFARFPFLLRLGAQLTQIMMRETNPLVWAVAVICHDIVGRECEDCIGVQGREVIALQIAVIADLPVRPRQFYLLVDVPVFDTERLDFIEHTAQMRLDIHRHARRQDDENQSASLFTGQLLEALGLCVHLTKFVFICDAY